MSHTWVAELTNKMCVKLWMWVFLTNPLMNDGFWIDILHQTCTSALLFGWFSFLLWVVSVMGIYSFSWCTARSSKVAGIEAESHASWMCTSVIFLAGTINPDIQGSGDQSQEPDCEIMNCLGVTLMVVQSMVFRTLSHAAETRILPDCPPGGCRAIHTPVSDSTLFSSEVASYHHACLFLQIQGWICWAAFFSLLVWWRVCLPVPSHTHWLQSLKQHRL